MSRHSRSPWRVAVLTGGGGYSIESVPEDSLVATVDAWSAQIGVMEADARLIAAAPDLAAALLALIPLAEEGIRAWAPLALEDELEAAHTLVEQARAALAKVEGK